MIGDEQPTCAVCESASEKGDYYLRGCRICNELMAYDLCVLCRDAAYLDRMAAVKPSLMLRRVADQFPEFEWLVWLPPEERRWYLKVGDPEYVRQSFFPHVPEWGYQALVA